MLHNKLNNDRKGLPRSRSKTRAPWWLIFVVFFVVRNVLLGHMLTSFTPTLQIPNNSSISVEGTGDSDSGTARNDKMVEDHLFSDFMWSKYCKADQVPCIALLSASHHGGIVSKVDPRSLLKRHSNNDDQAQINLRRRILVREAYCAIHLCDVIIDYNQYHENETMWLADHGKGKVGQMPPHWNKVASLKRWLSYGIFDAVLLLDMDTVIVDFDTSIYSMYESTPTVRFPGNPAYMLFRRGDVSRCIVDSWWYFGTSPGCRYFKYPQNHKGQTQDLDMPWLWYSVMKCSELYSHHQQKFECLNQCNGPKLYVDHLGKDPEHNKNFPLWIGECYRLNHRLVTNYTKVINSQDYLGKYLNYELQYGARLSETEAIKSSISVHRKDAPVMIDWLQRTERMLLNLNCSQFSCREADKNSLTVKLSKWGPERYNESSVDSVTGTGANSPH
mmetsp:Transcript_8602/g.14944  ORF Transcript_8602/g.14944 Transcript_8602/m.14944 type:complete len:445 (+) Transcript_8602:126-1460(+)